MERNFHGRWWLTSPVHQGDHGGAVKTIAQGMPFVSGGPCECACVFSFLHAKLRVHRASGIPCALIIEGARISCKTRARGVARSRSHVCRRLAMTKEWQLENLHQHTRCRPGLRAGTHNHKCLCYQMLERQSRSQPKAVVMGPCVRIVTGPTKKPPQGLLALMRSASMRVGPDLLLGEVHQPREDDQENENLQPEMLAGFHMRLGGPRQEGGDVVGVLRHGCRRPVAVGDL